MTAAPSMRVDDSERADLYARLLTHYHAAADRRGWVHVPCPHCGKEGSRANIHFSFSYDHGAKCQACGFGANLKQLCAKLDLLDSGFTPLPAPVRREPEIRHYKWMDELPHYLDLYTHAPYRYEVWSDYRSLSREQVDKYQLGEGYFPPYSSQCNHARLMLPMLQNGVPVAFRGRECDSECHHKKWLTTAMGNRSPLLYNGGVLLPEKDRALVPQYDLTDSLGPYCRSRVLVVVENPVDCLLLESAGISAVATLGVTMWTPERPWTQLLKLARPRQVLILFDHDLPGNGASSAAEYRSMVTAWKAAHNDAEPPLSNGLKLANHLNESGVAAACFRWPESAPLKADPGWLIEQVGLARIGDICHL
jgi:predicted RNA-binding Zn-ribbon protein involved in translation (DUF1610 family)